MTCGDRIDEFIFDLAAILQSRRRSDRFHAAVGAGIHRYCIAGLFVGGVSGQYQLVWGAQTRVGSEHPELPACQQENKGSAVLMAKTSFFTNPVLLQTCGAD